jgi:hypothetical protein
MQPEEGYVQDHMHRLEQNSIELDSILVYPKESKLLTPAKVGSIDPSVK